MKLSAFLVGSALTGGGLTVPLLLLISFGSIAHLSSGKYTDGDGKFIRSVTLLDKDQISSCDHLLAIALATFGGTFGAHQFYAGKPLKGVAMLFSVGGLGIWQFVNIYQIATNSFKDGSGKVICPDHIKERVAATGG